MIKRSVPSKPRTKLAIWLVVSQLLAAVTLFLWSIAAGLGYVLIQTSGEIQPWC